MEIIVRTIADRILDHSTYRIINEETGNTYEVATEASGQVSDLALESPYNDWKYWNGVLNLAFDGLTLALEDEKYGSFSEKNFRFAFNNVDFFRKNYSGQGRWGYPFGLMIEHRKLDDCGAMGASLIQVYLEDDREEYRAYIDKTADHIMNRQEKLDDGILCRPSPEEMTIWGDDLYMSVPFLARMGMLTGDQKYFDFAVLQVEKFNEYLFDPYDKLSYHCYYTNFESPGVAYWGRANGWMVMATAELLKFLPEDHPGREEVIRLFKRQILGLARYQGPDGMWHQLLDKSDSYKESSCTAMFVYSIALAVSQGWIDDRFAAVARKGWEGLTGMIRADGQVENICRGLVIHPDLPGYYNHGTPLNDIHGLGAILLAGVEMINLTK